MLIDKTRGECGLGAAAGSTLATGLSNHFMWPVA